VTGKAILVFEDDQFVAMAINDVLTGAGYSVSIVEAGGVEARKVVTEKKPDLIIMDMRLAFGTDGITTAGFVSEVSDVPIVLMSAYVKEIDQEEIKNSNFIAILEKPFNKEGLLRVVDQVFNG
jgi:CheY-like chemotaxis protein